MSDLYANPMSIPQGITSPDISSLYQSPVSQSLANQVLPSGAGVATSSLPYSTAAVGDSSSGLMQGLLGRATGNLPTALKWGGEAETPFLASAAGRGLVGLGVNLAGNYAGEAAGGDQSAAGRFLKGAGTVGGLTALLGPEVAVPAGLIGGTLNAIFGGSGSSDTDYRGALASTAQQLGLDPNQYTAAYDLLSKTGDPKQQASLLANQMIQDAQTQKQQAAQQQQEVTQRQMDQRFALAMQSQAQDFFSPYVNNIISSGATQAQLMQSLAQQLPAPYRGIMENQANQAVTQSQRLAGAYAAQSALIPGQFMAQAELKRQQQLAQLQYQQEVVQAQLARSRAGGASALTPQAIQQSLGQQTATTPAVVPGLTG